MVGAGCCARACGLAVGGAGGGRALHAPGPLCSALFGQGAVGLVLETGEKMESVQGYDHFRGRKFRREDLVIGRKTSAGGFILAIVLILSVV